MDYTHVDRHGRIIGGGYMKNTLIKKRYPFESSSGLTPQFKSFYLSFNREFTTLLKSIGAKNIDINRGHFDVYGFWQMPNDQWWYFSLGDVRWDKGEMLIRTAKSNKDYSGGANQYVPFDENLRNNILKIVNRRETGMAGDDVEVKMFR